MKKKTMTLSFDLDDLLIPGVKTFETEKQSLYQKVLGIEQIRKGTIDLFKKLGQDGHSIYIYTTSFRSIVKIKLMFFSHGIRIKRVINQRVHDKEMREHRKNYSKYRPPLELIFMLMTRKV
ncbi:hypothetical protein [Desertivirga brevis]|uniref:hypothetical protein n=1 Tax=Desertivirga brevis TaxID=2810310 RepID=UPI001A96F649|nr:hypothetical protein [Pedobacter sp. SYSU D00873]